LTSERILFLSDGHCGHIGGLTPPEYRINAELCKDLGGDWLGVEEKCWEFFVEQVKGKEFDGCICAGDWIEGKALKSGGRDLLVADRDVQVKIALRCLEEVNAKRWAFVYGTGYHVGQDERWERKIAKAKGAPIEDILSINIMGKLLRVKDHGSRTSTPVGGDIAIRKHMVHELVWQRDHGIQPADIYAFGHVHYYREIRDSKWVAFTLPALQAWTEFGANRCSGVFHFGTLEMEVFEDGRVETEKHLMELKTAKLTEVLEW